MAPIVHIADDYPAVPMAIDNGGSHSFRRPVRAQTYHEPTRDRSIIQYDDEHQKLNSDLQLAWTESMNPNFYTATTDYQKVQVLMLSWDEEIDDLKVQKEVNDLKDVFVDVYHFGVTQRTIKRFADRTAQTQVNAIVATWVNDHDALKTLLLVYFAGHGQPTKRNGELQLNPYKFSSYDSQALLNSVVWNNAEHSLREIQSDVLEILDCCYAGTLGTRGPADQAFECIAACGAKDTTCRPGPQSFTAALIWALKALAVDSGRFTTLSLVKKLCTAPDFPSDQRPVLSNRHDDQSNVRIVLQALPDSDKVEEPSPRANGTNMHNIAQEMVTLNLIFDARPSTEDIRKLGEGLNHIVYYNRLSVNRVVWGGIRPFANDATFAANSRLTLARRKAKSPYAMEQFQIKAAAAAAAFAQDFKEEVEESVQEQVHEQVHQVLQRELEFEAHNGKRRMFDRSPTN